MYAIFKSFSTELKFYLMMNTFFSFGTGLSAVFQSVFLWKLDKTYTLLAHYSLYWSITIIISFGICAWLARKTSPMIAMRLGFGFYLITYLIMLVFHDTLSEQIVLLGAANGMAMSLYYVGVHMAVLDLTTNDKRDQFLYIEGILLTISGIIAPLLAGIIISRFNGMTGYFIVFFLTCLFLVFAFITSLKIKGNPVTSKSYLWEVIRRPSREWKRMYPVMFADGIVSGAYTTFLITMMTFKVAGGEMELGIYNTAVEVVAILAFYMLAKFSKPSYRILLFAIGSISILLSSVLLSVFPVLFSLLIFGLLSPIAMTMISTSMNAMIYSSIESDEQYKEKRLDYIIIREIPLGVGRIIGVFIFLAMQVYYDIDKLLTVSFSFFPIVYVIMVPFLYSVWKTKKS